MHTIIKIAVVSVLALFAIVGVVSISNAETWSCSYVWRGEAEITVLKRSGNTFIESNGVETNIIFENDNIIHLYNTYGFTYFAQVLNKKEKSFSLVGIDGENDTDIITGKCVVN